MTFAVKSDGKNMSGDEGIGGGGGVEQTLDSLYLYLYLYREGEMHRKKYYLK